MVFEMFSHSSDDTFNYKYNEASAKSIEFTDDRRSVLIKSGIPLSQSVLDKYENDTLTHRRGWLVQVSDEENEYIFMMDRKVNGGSITHIRDGETNEHVYIFEGLFGQVLRVKYKYSFEGVDECAKADYLYLSDQFGDALFGQVTPSVWGKAKKIATLYRAENRVRKSTGQTYSIDMLCPSVEHPTNPDLYRKDQLNPFGVYFIQDDPNTPVGGELSVAWAGGGVATMKLETACEKIGIAVCEWLQ